MASTEFPETVAYAVSWVGLEDPQPKQEGALIQWSQLMYSSPQAMASFYESMLPTAALPV